MRQVGKTTLLSQIYSTIESPYKLLLDLENVLNQQYFEDDNYDRINLTIRNLVKADADEHIYLFLDEIQNIKKLPSIIKYLGDHFSYKFFLTGSVSFYLKNLFSESLAGRKYLFELNPLSFSEFLEFKSVKYKLPDENEKANNTLYQTFFPLYEEFALYGGFPAVVLAKNREVKEKKLSEIFSSYYEKDIVNFSDYRKSKIIRDLMLLLLARTGSKVKLTKLSSELGITRITLAEYLSFLEATYFIKQIRPFSRNIDTEIRQTPKIYVCDSGLANILGRASFGHVFETAIFHALYLKKPDSYFGSFLHYYQKKSGIEIDFLMDKKTAFEVKEKATFYDQKKLTRIAKDLKIEKNFLISYHFSKLENVVYGWQV